MYPHRTEEVQRFGRSIDRQAVVNLLTSLGFIEQESDPHYEKLDIIQTFYTLNNETIPCDFFLLKR